MGNLQEAKTKLEKQCEDLTWRLQLEKRMRVPPPPSFPSHFYPHLTPYSPNSTG